MSEILSTIDINDYGLQAMEAGGGGGSQVVTENDVNFYDYEGTLVKSYSKDDFLALDALPDNPEHEGLTAQGWNWSLADAKEYVTDYGKLNIGQNYVTDDGKTRIYIELEEGRLEPYLGFAINGTAVVDWGDGTSENVTGTSAMTTKYTQHIYPSVGEYVITIASEETVSLAGVSGHSLILTKLTTLSNENLIYTNAIKKVELGSNINIKANAFCSCKSLKSITIPTNISTMPLSAFLECTQLTGMTIPYGIENIQRECFQGCSKLKYIAIPKSTKIIDAYSFAKCKSITSITVPVGVTVLGTSAGFANVMYNCSSLKTITIPDTVTTIGANTFSQCESLKKIQLPSSITQIYQNAFSNCISLENIEIPSQVTSIADNTFSICEKLKKIIIPNTITSIGGYAFNQCNSALTIKVSKNITNIPLGAFFNCYNAAYYDFTESTSIPTLANTNAFYGIPSDCKIVVPDDLYEDWIVANNWSTYASNIVKESDF